MKYILFLATFFLSCQSSLTSTKHVFYLHGRIIELQGINAISEQYGRYEYQRIIDSLKSTRAVVHGEVRMATTDFEAFCQKTSKEIDDLINNGIMPGDITVIGASKGAVMAMNIANQNTHPINYVLLAANNDYTERENDWNLHGNILAIYEKSDAIGGKHYQYWIDRSTNAKRFKQIEINTGLGHGFLYRPIPEWWEPTKKWINQ